MVVGLTKVGTAIWIYSKLNTQIYQELEKNDENIDIYICEVQSVHF